MKWTEIKKWAKANGFNVLKTDSAYEWNSDNNELSGVEKSLSKLTKSLYNIMTNGKFIEHQQEYMQKNQDMNLKNDI